MLPLIDRIARAGAWVGGFGFLALSFVVLIEVLLRKIAGIGLSAATEMSSYVLAIAGAWGFAYALLQRAHVRVDALVRLLPRRALAGVDLMAQLVLTWLAAMMLWHGVSVFQFSWEKGAISMTPLQTPLWIPQGLWLAGLGFFLIACVVVLGRAARLLLGGEVADVNALIGTLSSEDEAGAEIEEAKLRYTGGGETRP